MRLLVLMLALALAAVAQNTKMLMSSGELAGLLQDPALVLLHVGSEKDYGEGHIAGSRLIQLSDISVTGESGLRMQLPAVAELVKTLGKYGITGTSRIVVYAAGESIQSATRVWFTLDYLGLGDRAALLDGGLLLWKAEGRTVTSEATAAAKETTFEARPRVDVVVDAAWIADHLQRAGSMQLYDARLPEFYSGASNSGMARAGRIPQAVNVPYPSLLANGRFKPADELRTLLGAKADVPVVTYCHIGMQATVPYFVARYLGLAPRLYDGSFQDWSSRSELPVETSPQR